WHGVSKEGRTAFRLGHGWLRAARPVDRVSDRDAANAHDRDYALVFRHQPQTMAGRVHQSTIWRRRHHARWTRRRSHRVARLGYRRLTYSLDVSRHHASVVPLAGREIS